MALELEIQQANINTVSVEIKALLIGKKQMTLSVFRQLDHKKAIDYETGEFVGLPWGRVNYCRGDCTSPERHTHVVWQGGGRLRQDIVYHYPDTHADRLSRDLIKSLEDHVKHYCILKYYEDPSRKHKAIYSAFDNGYPLKGFLLKPKLSDYERSNDMMGYHSEQWLKKEGLKDIGALESLILRETDNYNLKLIDCKQVDKKITDRINEVKQLQQLFIAV